MSTASQCPRCGLPRFFGVGGYAGGQCCCMFFPVPPAPVPTPNAGCQPVPTMTEARVREIVREELAKLNKESE
jgi:hypothetical protein